MANVAFFDLTFSTTNCGVPGQGGGAIRKASNADGSATAGVPTYFLTIPEGLGTWTSSSWLREKKYSGNPLRAAS